MKTDSEKTDVSCRPCVSLVLALVAGCALWPASAFSQVVLFDNGPVSDSSGTGVGGADESVLQTITLGDQDFGTAHGPVPFDERVADDFTVSDPTGWHIGEVVLYAYQTNLSTASTITSVNLRIWDGPPGSMGSSIVFGDTTTNRLVSSTFSGVYRVGETTPGAGNRAIMENRLAVTVTLAQGTYWLDWQTNGTLPNDGPWAPPIVMTGVGVTGNAMKYSNTGGWSALLDTGSANAKGLPFLLVESADGVTGAIPTLDEVGILVLVSLIALSATLLIRRRIA